MENIIPKEEWKDLAPYTGFPEGLYWISNHGRVMSRFGIRKLNLRKNGYFQVGLSHNGEQKTFFVHRLVAQAFIPNDDPEHKGCVGHKNNIKTDNREENLY